MSRTSYQFRAGQMQVEVFETSEQLGGAAASNAASIISRALQSRQEARVIFATGNSQLPFVEALLQQEKLPWEKVVVFHMDEYVGIREDHPASFRRWIRERIEEPVHPKKSHYIEGDAPDLQAECRRYEALLKEAPLDLVCMGIGENGHIAFNDPPVANFEDPLWVKVVELDEACRNQQVGEGHFRSFEEVPTHAVTLTVPALLGPAAVQVVVPERRKAQAVRDAIEGPISTRCPASILRRQPHARLFLDAESAALIQPS